MRFHEQYQPNEYYKTVVPQVVVPAGPVCGSMRVVPAAAIKSRPTSLMRTHNP